MDRQTREYYNEIDAQFGCAVSGQFKEWIEGASLVEMNPNALRRIASVLRDFAFTDDEARDFLDEIEEFLEQEDA